MSVNDHGLEVLKKAAEEVVSGSKSEYYLKMKLIDAIEGSFTPSGLQNGGRTYRLNVGDASWQKIEELTGALTQVNAISIQNNSTSDVYLRYDTAPAGLEGVIIRANGGQRFYDISNTDIPQYLKSALGSVIIDIEEIG